MNEPAKQLVQLTQQLLDSIAAADWKTYEGFCDPSLTAFEPEARGELVSGMDFHRFYFDHLHRPQAIQTTMVSPHVRVIGEDAAVVSYIRLIQLKTAEGDSRTVRFEETRVWQKQGDTWKNVHFHRSDSSGA